MQVLTPASPRPCARLLMVVGMTLTLSGIGGLAPAAIAQDTTTSGFFDSSFVHSISIDVDQDEYAAAIAAYHADETKEWLDVSAVIDGVTYEDVGMRLKGNSSLRGLSGDRGGFPGRGQGQPAPSESAAPSQPADIATQAPESLPWLLRLDRNVDGQSIDGVTDLVVRSNSSETSLNEAVALELLSASGLASQEAAATGFSVNGSDPVLRLVIEDPEDHWMAANFEGAGALYKAESTGDWSYRGDDPASYEEVFDQEAGDEVTDLTPLIGLLQWIDESDQATFSAGLAERLDVDGFATYLAMMDLLDNFDDIDGPGNNGYLYWDAATGVFTFVPWDMNLAFGASPGGGGFGGPGGQFPGRPNGSFDPSQFPGGSFEPPAGFEPPTGFEPPEDGQGQFGGRMNRSNPLVEKFRADATFAALIETKKAELRVSLFDSGLAQSILDSWTGVLESGASSLVDAATIQAESSSLAGRFPSD